MSSVDKISSNRPKNRSAVTDYDGEVTVYGQGEMQLNPGAIVNEGDLVGYDEKGDLYIFENAPGGLNRDLPEDSEFDEFAELNSAAMKLPVAAYLDTGRLSSNSQASTGEELHDLAERTLESTPKLKIEADEEGNFGRVTRI